MASNNGRHGQNSHRLHPDVLGGKPCIAGTRIRVQDIYQWHELQGKSPDEIVSSFPQLTMADVYAALAYFWDIARKYSIRYDGRMSRSKS